MSPPWLPCAVLCAVAAFVGPGRFAAAARLHALWPRPSTSDEKRGPRGPGWLALGGVVGAVAGLLGGGAVCLLLGAAAGAACWLAERRRRRKREPPAEADPLALASGWDLLAACLHGGLPVPDAVRAVAAGMPGEVATALCRTADLIALGADPVTAWAPALDHTATAELARGARRTARSGAALAGVAESLAGEVRAAAGDLAEERAQRAAVAATGPLGLCFLPAFLCLGVAPVVIGLATRLFTTR